MYTVKKKKKVFATAFADILIIASSSLHLKKLQIVQGDYGHGYIIVPGTPLKSAADVHLLLTRADEAGMFHPHVP